MGKLIYGLTGIMGSGKTTVARLFKELGAFIVDADQLAKHILTSEYTEFHEVKREIEHAFAAPINESGRKLFSGDELDRSALADIVFKNKQALQRLNNIIHPRVHRLFEERINNKEGIIIYDVPLLYENQLENNFEKVILAYAPEEICIKRAALRTADSEENIKKRIQSQISIETKKKRADYIIDNSRGSQNLKKEVNRVWGLINNEYEKSICTKSDT